MFYLYNGYIEQYNISNRIHINPAHSQPYTNPECISFSVWLYIQYQCDILMPMMPTVARPSLVRTNSRFCSTLGASSEMAPRHLLSLPHWYLFARYTRLRIRTPTAERDALHPSIHIHFRLSAVCVPLYGVPIVWGWQQQAMWNTGFPCTPV